MVKSKIQLTPFTTLAFQFIFLKIPENLVQKKIRVVYLNFTLKVTEIFGIQV